MGDFNLIVSTYRFREKDAQAEMLDILEIFGDPEPRSEDIEIKGLLVAQTSLDPLAVIDKLRELVA